MSKERSALGVLFLTVFLDLLGFGLIIPALGPYARQLALEGQISQPYLAATSLGFVYSGMQFLFTPLWGKLSDRIGRRPVLLISIAGSVLGFAAVGLAPSFWLLLLARAFSGVMTSNISVAQAYIADVTPPERRARGMGIIGASFGLGFLLGPFIGGELAGRFGLIGPSFLAAGLSLINFFWAFFALPETRKAAEAPAERQRRSRVTTLRELWSDPRLSLLLLIFFISTFAFANMEQTFALMVQEKFIPPDPAHPEAEAAEATLLAGRFLGFIGIISVILQGWLAGRLVKRFGEPRLIAVGLFAMTAGFFLVVPVEGLALFFMPLSFLSIGQGVSSPSMNGLFSRLSDPERQGEILGLSQSAAALARILGPAWGGYSFDVWGYEAPYLTGGVFMGLSFFIALRLSSRLAREIAVVKRDTA